MNKQRLQDEIKKRRTSPYFSSTYTDNISSININQTKRPNESITFLYKEGQSKNNFCCSNPSRYKNGLGKLRFWSCKNCGADLGDIND
jgi:hypothetical protein